jgi:hypothetical protein
VARGAAGAARSWGCAAPAGARRTGGALREYARIAPDSRGRWGSTASRGMLESGDRRRSRRARDGQGSRGSAGTHASTRGRADRGGLLVSRGSAAVEERRGDARARPDRWRFTRVRGTAGDSPQSAGPRGSRGLAGVERIGCGLGAASGARARRTGGASREYAGAPGTRRNRRGLTGHRGFAEIGGSRRSRKARGVASVGGYQPGPPGSIRQTFCWRRLESQTEPWPTRTESPPGPVH